MALITLGLQQPEQESRGNPFENPSVSLGNVGAILSWISGNEGPTASGEIIDHDVALSIVTVYSCIRLIAETVASLPLKLYRRLDKGRIEAVDNNLYDLLTIAPNPEMSAVVFWETQVGCLALTGNAYAYIQRVDGQVEALWPLNPKKTYPIRLPNGKIGYRVTEGLGNGEIRVYQAEDVLHFRLFSWDGLKGLSPIELARQSLGLSRAAEKMGSRLFANNGRPSGVMSTEAQLDEKTILNVRESWQAAQTGENALKTAFLPGNWKYTPMSLNMEDIEFINTRKYQRSEIAALYRVPPHLVGDTTRQSNTNSEQEALTLVTLTLRPYLSRIENEIQKVLLPTLGRNAGKMFVEFDVTQLLRGDFKSSNEGYNIGRIGGWFSANDIREDMGLNPIGPEGDVYLCPVNYMNAKNLLLTPEPAPATPQDVNPGTETPIPTDDAERSIVHKAQIISTIFRDCIGRLIRRDKHSFDDIYAIFEPTLRSIAVLSIGDATKKLNIEWDDEKALQRIVTEACRSIEHRSKDWGDSTADELVFEEFRKTLKQIVVAVYKDVSAVSVVSDTK